MPGPGMELIGQEEIEAVVSLLESGYLLRYSREDNPRFQARVHTLEKQIANRCGVKHAIGLNSGTSALLVALLALGIGPGDEVIVPGYTFVASISSILYAGAVPVLAEVNRTLNLDPSDVAKKITPRTKAIMVVHMLGNPALLDPILAMACENSLLMIEDCAQAFGGTYKGSALGTFGDVGTFSFNGFKTITAGDGGMLITRDSDLYRRCYAIHDQGHLPHRMGVEIGARTLVGLDFRLTELQAAVLLVQLNRLDGMLERLRSNKVTYKALIQDIPGLEFRQISDPKGEIATILTVYLPEESVARKIAAELGTKVIADSGWHVYNHMEHILTQRMPTPYHNPLNHPQYVAKGGDLQYERGMLPQTDELLNRAINISIGVSDPGLGSGFGITVRSDEAEIVQNAERFRYVCERYL